MLMCRKVFAKAISQLELELSSHTQVTWPATKISSDSLAKMIALHLIDPQNTISQMSDFLVNLGNWYKVDVNQLEIIKGDGSGLAAQGIELHPKIGPHSACEHRSPKFNDFDVLPLEGLSENSLKK